MSTAISACSIFFRSQAFRLAGLWQAWQGWVLPQRHEVEIEGRCVLLGDHTHVVKDGGRMPGVVSLRETAETQSTPTYFRGQCWGALGLLVGSLSGCFCLPLQLQIHLGFRHLGVDEETVKGAASSLAERVVQMALALAVGHDRLSLLVLDAFFAIAPVFRLARSVYAVASRQPYLQILVRAKKNYVAYFPAAPKPPHRHGPQPRYGDKMGLMSGFDYLHLFEAVSAEIYGKTETVRLMAAPLLWKPLGDWVLFIWAITSRGPIVLMCSDLTLSPITALELYCVRTRIEIMFAMLKHLRGAFRFRFWSKKLPRHSRHPTANRHLNCPAPEHQPQIHACWQAYEIFVLCAAIAQGLLQLIALRFGSHVWQHASFYLRTQSRALPSERTVKQVLVPLILQQLVHLPAHGVLQKIRHCLVAAAEDESEDHHSAA